MLFKKDTEILKIKLLQAKSLIQIIAKFRQGWKNFVHISHAPNILLRGSRKRLFSNTLKRANCNCIFFWKKIDLHVLRIVKARFRFTILLLVSEKSITRCRFLQHCGASMHQKPQQGIHRKMCISILSALKLTSS